MEKTAKAFMRSYFWYATDNNNSGKSNKYVGQPFWSLEAIKLYLTQKNENYTNRENGLRHEHAIPIKLLTEKAWQNIEGVNELIVNFSRAVVVTKDEDNRLKAVGLNDKLPTDFDWENPNLLMRYSAASITQIYDVRQSEILENLLNSNRREFMQLLETLT